MTALRIGLRLNPVRQHWVLIVDDHDGFRSAARLMLENDGIRVVGEVEDGRRAMAVRTSAPRSGAEVLTSR